MKTINITTLNSIIDNMIQEEEQRCAQFISNNPSYKNTRTGHRRIYDSALIEARYKINAAAQNG